MKEAAENTTLFDWENFEDFDVKRQFSKLSVIGTAKLPEEKIKEVSKGIELRLRILVEFSFGIKKKQRRFFPKWRQSFIICQGL